MIKFYKTTQDFKNDNNIYIPHYELNCFDIYNYIFKITKDDKNIYVEAKKDSKLLITGDYELIEQLVETIFISNLKISGIKGEATITKRFIECYSKYFDGIFTKDEDGYIYKEGSLKVVIFAGGCFWCAANNFYSLKGVKEVYSGYASGDVFFPTYEEVKTGLTGHRESIFIYYNEEEVSYRELIIAFFENIDPFDEDGQFIDRGPNYQTAVFTDDDGQVELFYRAKKYIETNYGGEVKVRLLPNVVFFLAEEDHQEFSIKNKERFLEEEKLSGRDIYQGVKFK